MKKIVFATLCLSSVILGLASAAEPRAPTDAEIRFKQAIGRAVVSPDGTYFVYEWMRPYNWVRDTGKLPAGPANRMQTWLYRVDIDRTPPNSEYLFYQGAADSYWMGSFTPDGGKYAFYQLDNDENVLKTGVVEFTDPVTPKLTWLDPAPDANKLDQAPVWLSNDEVAYPAQSGWVRAKIPAEKPAAEQPINMLDYDKPLKADACADCTSLVAQAKAASAAAEQAKLDKEKRKKAAKLPADSRLLAQSPDGELSVFERSNKKIIGVLFRKGADSPETVVFENERVLAPYTPPKQPEKKDDAAAKPEEAKPATK
jgi:hypothetical protein